MSTDLNDFKIIKEGEAEILMHAKNEVFYNKTQVNNRDLSIAVLRTFIEKRKLEHEAFLTRRTKSAEKVLEKELESVPNSEPNELPKDDVKFNGEREMLDETPQEEPCSVHKDIPESTNGKGKRELKPPRVLEALSASGLRALRYAREVEGIGQVVAVDNDKASVEACRRNIKFNGSVACSKVESHLADARVFMLTHPKEFDVVDLDPYGSPSVFLDSAVQSVVDGGMLMCTATDMAVLCGGNGEVCYSKYGSYPLRGKYCHEMALRILLACIESHANRYKRYIVPVLSVQMDFYIRVFVRIYTSASAMKNTPLKLSYVYQCTGCDSFHLQQIGRTVSKNNSMRYLPGFGPVVPQECTDCGKKFNMGGPIWSAPIHDHEWVTSILADLKSMKDRYPAYDRISAVLTTISEVKSHPVKEQPSDQPGSVILAKEPAFQANFARAVASLSKAQAKKVARFLPNPERHWGPKLRAGRQITSKHISLLGPEAVNGSLKHDDDDDDEEAQGEAKRQKTEDPTLVS
ncbi:probable tRNA (guanine(26)-N(2))-dimethyltransferase 2 isoform X3 [Eucalyptus grandis]|uniref:probable tRNA (guanine(26)-N(2))-dimethyltransferase 2 isoform X3 n=1 Tax=Eucalyptus grandis TaxID=71139 RepID=UPI00192EE93A|nr:probable tRNA (guanine(26)-N(2))-dimethyltransferase 2 isoform X3 [Eucalyptus grandis]